MIIRGERNGRGGKNREIGIDVYTVLYVKQVINKNLLYSTGNFYSIFCGDLNGKEIKKKKKKTKKRRNMYSSFTLLYSRN